MKRGRPKQYSRRTKRWALAVLERNGGNRYQTAKETGIPHTTLGRWIKEAESWSDPPPIMNSPPPQNDDIGLDDQFEDVAYQLVAALPEKLEEANLHQIIEALKFVLDKVGQAEDGEGADVYEKLAHLINRYAAGGTADGDPQPPDES